MISPSSATRRRRRVDASYAIELAGELTDRDRRIALDCYDHRALTTEQLRRLHFHDVRHAQRRLAHLHELRVLERVRPPWRHGEGSTPYHWLLGEAGAYLVAAELGVERTELRWRHEGSLALARSPKLAHQIAVNELMSRLAQEAAAAGGALREWWGERRLHETLAGKLIPDAYGRAVIPGEQELAFLLELDRGTENLARLQAKLDRYERLLPRSRLAVREPFVLLCLPGAARAANAGRLPHRGAVAVATVTWTPAQAGSVLALLRSAHERSREARR